MLDGYYKARAAASVIVGQNWEAGEQDQERDRDSSSSLKMVDMIHHQQQEIRIPPPPPIYSVFDRDPQQQQQQQQLQQLDASRTGVDFPGFFSGAGSAGSFSLYHHQSHELQQRRYHFVNLGDGENSHEGDDEEQQKELRLFFPSKNNSSSTGTGTGRASKKLKTMSIPGEKIVKAGELEVGEDLLSLRPPSSGLSEITTNTTTTTTNNKNNNCSSPEASESFRNHMDHHHHHHHQNQQQQQILPQNQQQQQVQQPLGLELLNMLLECAQAVNSDDLDSALNLLSQLKQGASVYGDSMQRLTAHFSEGLATRILRFSPASALNPDRSLFLRSLINRNLIHSSSSSSRSSRRGHDPSLGDYLGAFTALYPVSPFFRLAHFTANQAILEATEGCDRVHVVDLDIMQGLQWPSFIQALASRPGGPPELLRITGIGPDEDSLRETGERLAGFASGFHLQFRFHPVVSPPGGIGEFQDLQEVIEPPLPGEALAVNSQFQLHRLLNRPTAQRDLERFLAGLRRLAPCAVTIAEQEAAHNCSSFIPRFVEALHYYAAVFDSLDASLPQRNEERVLIEQALFARQIRDIVSCEGEDRVERHERMGFWSGKMSECGFVQLPMSSHSLSQAKLLLQLCPCDGYRIAESANLSQSSRVGSISLGWQDRLLLTTSSWA